MLQILLGYDTCGREARVCPSRVHANRRMSAKKSGVDVWGTFRQGGALSVDVVSRSEAEELSSKVAHLEDEVRHVMDTRDFRSA